MCAVNVIIYFKVYDILCLLLKIKGLISIILL
jgi:hypothetical protein